jgi:hypothetical protein
MVIESYRQTALLKLSKDISPEITFPSQSDLALPKLISDIKNL